MYVQAFTIESVADVVLCQRETPRFGSVVSKVYFVVPVGSCLMICNASLEISPNRRDDGVRCSYRRSVTSGPHSGVMLSLPTGDTGTVGPDRGWCPCSSAGRVVHRDAPFKPRHFSKPPR